jgi:energy-coupling factor transporter ATP-binding protein EcfA2
LDCLNLSDAAMGTLVNYLDRQALLELQTFELADQPHIELVVDGKPRSIFELSIGQKCTAILTLLLVESDIPLIVDQPEDSLDNKFIYEEVVQLLRQEKEGRQFIIATHNANIPVLGDAELILALEAGEDRGWVEQRDALDNLAVQEAAKKILEGGREAFERRREKYGF